jgi:hypothetical protein
LSESLELSGRRGTVGEVHEVGFHATLGEEAECLASVGVFRDSKDLYFHECVEASVTATATSVLGSGP